jgi:protein-S-isoprenylcysteine O-methyltransferase Ste14
MIPAVLGVALLTSSVVALGAFVALVGALELQIRLVEKPYLLRTRGEHYADYTSRVGRFFLGVGRISSCS